MSENLDIFSGVLINLYVIFTSLITGIFFSFLCRNFMIKKGAWLAGIVYFLVNSTLYYMPFFISNFAAYFISVFAAFIVIACIDRRNIKMKIFLASTFFIIRWIVLSFASKLIVWLSNSADWFVSRRYDVNAPEMWLYVYIHLSVLFLLSMVLSCLFLFFTVKAISSVFVYKQKEPDIREFAFLILPSLIGGVMYKIFDMYNDVIGNEVEASSSYFIIDGLWILVRFIIFVSIMSNVFIYQFFIKKQEEENSKIILENEIKVMQSHIIEVEKIYTDIRGVRHDIKNHISVIKNLLEQGDINEAKSYLSPLKKTVERFEFKIKTGNPVTDVIIHEKMREAEERNIAFTSNFYYPSKININAFDISIIISNALSNAIEAADIHGFVSITSFQNKNAYLIIVKNSFSGKLMIDEKSDLPKTLKEDKKAHGLGMYNMKMIAAKYCGDIMIEQKDNIVELTAILMNA